MRGSLEMTGGRVRVTAAVERRDEETDVIDERWRARVLRISDMF